MENVLSLVGRYCEPKKAASTKGGEYHCPCPGCGGTDRFHVWPEENHGEGSWWCRQCGKGGDGIQFLREFEGLSYRDACERLGHTPREASDYRVPKPNLNGKGGKPMWKPDAEQGPPPELWREKAHKFVVWAFDNLMAMQNDEGPKGWLAKRGINEYVIKYFGLGWNPGKDGKDLFRPRESWGLPTELKPDGRKKMMWIPQGLVIPLLEGKEIHRIRIRRESGEPRYYVLPGSSMRCLVEGDAARAYAIVESELDAMMIHHWANYGDAITGVVALGNSSRKPDVKTAAILQNAAVILNALDYDHAGANQGQWWTNNFPRTKRWPVPLGKDPGESFEQGVDIREWIKGGLPKGWFL